MILVQYYGTYPRVILDPHSDHSAYPRVVQDYSTYEMVVQDSDDDYGADRRVVK